jgi:hypothetical protein
VVEVFDSFRDSGFLSIEDDTTINNCESSIFVVLFLLDVELNSSPKLCTVSEHSNEQNLVTDTDPLKTVGYGSTPFRRHTIKIFVYVSPSKSHLLPTIQSLCDITLLWGRSASERTGLVPPLPQPRPAHSRSPRSRTPFDPILGIAPLQSSPRTGRCTIAPVTPRPASM